MYDINTKNISFLKVSQQLRQFGVKNNKFMLWLNDPDLSGIDVYSPNLSSLMKAKILTEIARNYWYFLREVVLIPAEGSTDGIHYEMNVGRLAMAYCNINNLDSIVLLPRQQGKTVGEVVYSDWVHLFGTTNSLETYLHVNQDGANGNLARFKTYRDFLPTWLTGAVSSKNDKDNLEEKYFALKNNRIKAKAAASTDTAADKLGRGSSTALVYIDEFAFLDRNEIIYQALLPAHLTAAANAKKNHAPYGIRVTTTPNTLALPQARYCYKMMTDAYRFNYGVYDIPEDKLHAFIEKNSGNNFVWIQYSYQELGVSEAAFQDYLKKNGNNMLVAKREYLLVWPETSGESLFSEKQMDTIRALLKPVVTTLLIDGYEIKFYEKPNIYKRYILACDVSGGLSQDRSVILFCDPSTFAVCGIFFNARIDTDAFRSLIADVMTYYLPYSILVMENNSYGLAILDVLKKNTELEPRVYREVLARKAEIDYKDGERVAKTTKKVVYGVSTNVASRKLMYDLLGDVVINSPELVVSDDFYNEIKTLVLKGADRIEAAKGEHDDIVMSYLVFRYAVKYGTYLEEFGIQKIPTAAVEPAQMIDAQNQKDKAFINIMNAANRVSTQTTISSSDNKTHDDASDSAYDFINRMNEEN